MGLRSTEKVKVRVLVYHGTKRAKGEVDLGQYDFVLTSYSTIESDCRKHIAFRIGEATLPEPLFALKGEYNWVLSGTPLQNRVGELYSLFLEVFPYSYYLCKDCKCRLQDFSSSKVCTDCGHCIRHFCWWNEYIARHIQVSSSQKGCQRAMTLLRETVMKNIVSRRTKKGRAADIALPSKIVTLRRDSMDEQEHRVL
ncbi:hypothetical protein FCM35_KLT04650 [Carex littledalei]|uniref:SNF2 N-terminal domain-containing protein n=1 Tax=Carex littledalei TaxID=544730 RepID=A0A833QTK0_9POAL|nr:hypothetical protein FCM35_KLT04650 [Carex littledalei]